ncbi:unnamed protein product [Callosobruchus maculatus]|uniref:THAP-type domain-containing protein n=1 Tax=Callosobruchus maculatus TaxID=64391 RepID=A0A653D411_CALMS|nr:unnamed protein product [Callosobruchus maculatus]
MVRTCSVCKKEYIPGEGRSCHTVPKSPSLRQKWHAVLAKCGIFGISENTSVCSDHFVAEDYYVAPAGRKLLRKGAVPSISLASETVQCMASEQSLVSATADEACSAMRTVLGEPSQNIYPVETIASDQFPVMAMTLEQTWQYPAAER